MPQAFPSLVAPKVVNVGDESTRAEYQYLLHARRSLVIFAVGTYLE